MPKCSADALQFLTKTYGLSLWRSAACYVRLDNAWPASCWSLERFESIVIGTLSGWLLNEIN